MQTVEIRSTDVDAITLLARQATDLIQQGVAFESYAPEYRDAFVFSLDATDTYEYVCEWYTGPDQNRTRHDRQFYSPAAEGKISWPSQISALHPPAWPSAVRTRP
jgi:hypothetical protein